LSGAAKYPAGARPSKCIIITTIIIIIIIGREEPEDKPPPTTQEGLRKLAERTQMRKDELQLAFNLKWTRTEPETIKKVVGENWCLEETGGPLWDQCAKLRELVLDERMPLFSCEDRQRTVDSTWQEMASS
jgi:hypothetical protein